MKVRQQRIVAEMVLVEVFPVVSCNSLLRLEFSKRDLGNEWAGNGPK